VIAMTCTTAAEWTRMGTTLAAPSMAGADRPSLRVLGAFLPDRFVARVRRDATAR
jgi:hypothetical protein